MFVFVLVSFVFFFNPCFFLFVPSITPRFQTTLIMLMQSRVFE